jgi:hypothetical protein
MRGEMGPSADNLCSLLPDPSNAAPEWQAGALERKQELMGACPLEGLVRKSIL